MKNTVLAMAIVGLGLSFAGCAAIEEGAEASGGKAGKASKPDMKVEATAILKQFEENEAAADGKYKGKTLQVSGVIDKIDTELLDDDEYVINIGGGGDFVLFTVDCGNQAAKTVAKLKKGQKITVVGDFEDGGDLGVELSNCVVK